MGVGVGVGVGGTEAVCDKWSLYMCVGCVRVEVNGVGLCVSRVCVGINGKCV